MYLGRSVQLTRSFLLSSLFRFLLRLGLSLGLGHRDEDLEVVVDVEVGEAVDEAVVDDEGDLTHPVLQFRLPGNQPVKEVTS